MRSYGAPGSRHCPALGLFEPKHIYSLKGEKSMRVLTILFLLIGAFLLAACQTNAAPQAVTPVVVTEIERVEVPADPGRLVIYSGRSESLVGPIIDQFAAVTGIQVEVRYGSTSELAATILEEGRNSPADVYYAQDPGALGALAARGLFAPLPVASLEKVAPRFVADDGSWVGISGRARVVVYNTDLVDPADLPDDIWGFVEPQWRGRIGWAPTNGSFQAMLTGMRAVWGEEQTREWVRGIQANDPVVYSNNTSMVTGVAAGEAAVGFTNHYYLYNFIAQEGEGFKARNYFLPNGGPASLLMVSGVGILQTAPNVDNAQRFVDFLLSVPAQQYFATRTNEYPVVEGVATAPALPPLAEIDAMATDMNLADLADLPGTAQMLSELGVLP
jgi:iron(III) transport system substrate-binding protein